MAIHIKDLLILRKTHLFFKNNYQINGFPLDFFTKNAEIQPLVLAIFSHKNSDFIFTPFLTSKNAVLSVIIQCRKQLLPQK